MKTIIVTGGYGFIGSHFVRFLLQETGWRVINFDNLSYAGIPDRLEGVKKESRYCFIKGDIADRVQVDQLFRTVSPWAVVNFAAESHVDRSILDSTPFLRTNVLGVQVLLEAIRSFGVFRFLQVSTDEVYGEAEGNTLFSEDNPIRPSSPYAASKGAADLLCLAYRRTYHLPIIITRSANNYGPFQFPEKLIPLMIRNALCGEVLPIYGDGAQIRDWLYVEDHCRAVLSVLEKGRIGDIYNIGADDPRPNLGVVRMICQLLAEATRTELDTILRCIRFVPDRPGHDRCYALDTRKIRSELGWSPRMRFEDGLRHSVRWYLDHRDWVMHPPSDDYTAYYKAVYNRAWNQVPE